MSTPTCRFYMVFLSESCKVLYLVPWNHVVDKILTPFHFPCCIPNAPGLRLRALVIFPAIGSRNLSLGTVAKLPSKQNTTAGDTGFFPHRQPRKDTLLWCYPFRSISIREATENQSRQNKSIQKLAYGGGTLLTRAILGHNRWLSLPCFFSK